MIILLVLTYDDVPEDSEDGSYFGTPPPSYHSGHHKLGQSLPHVEMVRPAQTQPEIVKEEEKELTPKKKDLTEEEKKIILMSEDFKKFLDRAVRVTERALFYNEPADIYVDYTGAHETIEK